MGLVACAVRNRATYEHFVSSLAHSQLLQAADVSDWAHAAAGEPMFYCDPVARSAIRVLKVSRKVSPSTPTRATATTVSIPSL